MTNQNFIRKKTKYRKNPAKTCINESAAFKGSVRQRFPQNPKLEIAPSVGTYTVKHKITDKEVNSIAYGDKNK